MARVLIESATSEFRRTLRSKTRIGLYALCYAIVSGKAKVFVRVPCRHSDKNGKGKGQDTYFCLATLPDAVAAVEWSNRKCKCQPVAIPACWVEGRKIDKPLPPIPTELKGGFWSKVRRLFSKAA